MAALDLVDAYLEALPGDTRRLETGHWGLTVPADRAAGWPLDVGVRVADGLLRVQAFAAPAAAGLEPRVLLAWNRHTRFVRFGSTRDGDVWVHGDLPAARLSEADLDRLLGLVVEGAVTVREHAAAVTSARPAPRDGAAAGTGWGSVPRG